MADKKLAPPPSSTDDLSDLGAVQVDDLSDLGAVAIDLPEPSLGVATSISKPESFGHRMARVTTGQLPGLGATIGGVLGAVAGGGAGSVPLAVGGASVGAGAGEYARQLIGRWYPDLTDAPKSTIESIRKSAEQIAMGGASEAGSPLLTAGINRVFQSISPLVRRSGARQLRAVMQPLGSKAEGESLRASERILGKGGYIAPTRSALEKKAEGQIASLGADIEGLEKQYAAQEIHVRPILNSLDKFEKSLMMPPVPTTTGGSISPRLNSGPQLNAIAEVRDKLQSATMINPYTGKPAISRESLRLIKRDLDDYISTTSGNFAAQERIQAGAIDPAISYGVKAKTHMANRLRDILNKDAPDIAELNEEFSIWKSVKDAMSPTSLREEFPKDESLWTRMWHSRYAMWLGTAAAGGAGYHASGAPGAAVAVGGLIAVNQLVKSTAWRTMSASTKNSVADMLANGMYEDVAKFATRILAQGNTKEYVPEDKDKVQIQTMGNLLSPPPSFRPE